MFFDRQILYRISKGVLTFQIFEKKLFLLGLQTLTMLFSEKGSLGEFTVFKLKAFKKNNVSFRTLESNL